MSHSPRFLWVSPFAVLCCLVTSCEKRADLRKGDLLFSIADDAVLSVSLRAPGKYAEARREVPEQSFTYRFERDGSSPQACKSNGKLDAARKLTRSVHVKDTLSREEIESVSEGDHADWVELEVRDVMTGIEPVTLKLIRDPKDRSRLYATLTPDSQMVAVSSKLIGLLDERCP